MRADRHPHRAVHWILYDITNGRRKPIGGVCLHVDDFLFAGDHSFKAYRDLRERLRNLYRWSDWEEGHFTQTSIEIVQLDGFSFTNTQGRFCMSVEPIEITSARRLTLEALVTERGKSQLRAMAGSCQWTRRKAPHTSCLTCRDCNAEYRWRPLQTWCSRARSSARSR